jgi:hypothetical protein
MNAVGWLLAAWLGSAPTPSVEGVLVHRDGRVERLSGGLAGLALDDVGHAWLWAPSAAPRRVRASEVSAWRPERSRQRLRVQVTRRPGEKLAGHRMVMAPLEMWHEVPETMLPAWDVPPSGKLTLPDDAARPRRLRLLASGRGSWWQDIPTGREQVILTPSPAADRVIAVTGPDGAPVRTATITVLDGVPGRPRQEVLAIYGCEPAGSATLPALPDAGILTLVVATPAHAPAAIVARPEGLPAETRLRPGAAVHGVIVDEQGRPLTGATVSAEAWIDPQVPALVARRASTGSDGAWRLSALPLGEVALEAVAERFAAHRRRIDLDAEEIDLGRIALQRGHLLAVRVVDDLGAAVASAEVRVGAVAATSDRLGRARLSRVPGGGDPFTIEARADGHLPVTRTVTPPLTPELEVSLQRAFQVRGRFVTAERTPVTDGGVRVETGSAYRDEPMADGAVFELDLRPELAAVLVLRSPATQDVRLSLEPGRAGERRDLGDIAAPAGWVVRGRAVRADDGEPVAGVRVWCPRPSESGEIASWVHGDLVETKSGHDGDFALTGLPDRPVLLRLDGPGLARAYRPVQPDANSPAVDLGEVPLAEGAALRVVIDADRSEGAVARADLRAAWLESDMLTAAVVDGGATLHHVPPGAVKLTVLAGRDLLCEKDLTIPAAASDVEVVCDEDPLRVTGVVLAGSYRARGGRLYWTPPADEIPPGLIMHRTTARGLRQDHVFGAGRPHVEVEIGMDGTFTTEALRPGRWSVAWLPAGGALSPPREVELPRAEHHALTLTFSELTIAGQVVGKSGEPVASAQVRDLDSAATALSDQDGGFLIVDLAPGRHRLVARSASLTSDVVAVELAPDRETDPVVLTVEERSDRLEVRVQTADGPGAHALVFVELEGAGVRLASADTEGIAWVALEPPLPERVRSAAFAGGAWGFGAWRPLSATDPSLSLRIPPGGTLLLASEASGEPVIATGGWDVSRLLTLVGMRPSLRGAPLMLTGLPPGQYTVALGQLTAAGEVRADRPLALDLR